MIKNLYSFVALVSLLVVVPMQYSNVYAHELRKCIDTNELSIDVDLNDMSLDELRLYMYGLIPDDKIEQLKVQTTLITWDELMKCEYNNVMDNSKLSKSRELRSASENNATRFNLYVLTMYMIDHLSSHELNCTCDSESYNLLRATILLNYTTIDYLTNSEDRAKMNILLYNENKSTDASNSGNT